MSSKSLSLPPPACILAQTLNCCGPAATTAAASPQIPLHVYSYKDLYGWTMDEIVREIGTKSNCTFCGVFRRQVRRCGRWCGGGDDCA